LQRGRRNYGAEEAQRSRVSGGPPVRQTSARYLPPKADPATFKPSPTDDIQPGAIVMHLKFGEGKVLALDGGKDNRIATIHFKGLPQPQKRIMLRFAKLQIL
jgi:DNA helicase-2/ATP-dependent DNA helicase PcrA